MVGRVSESLIRNSCMSISKEGEYLRVVWSKSIPIKGFEKVGEEKDCKEKSDGRFESSIARTRSTVRQYARCNEWNYFVTLTISPDKWDRFDLKEFYKSFGKYLSNINQRRKDGKKLLYMLIPEQHKNGAWHFHGLMKDIPENVMGVNLNGYTDWPALREKYGFCSFSPIRDHEAVSLYITKYITKEALKTELPKGYKFILASNGLKKAKPLRKIYGVAINLCKGIFEFDYVSEDGNTAIYTIKPTKDIEDKFLSDIDILFSKEAQKKCMCSISDLSM